jgi:hypothetical protein
VLKVFRAVVDVAVVGARVGGLLNVLLLVEVRADVGFVDVVAGRFVVVVPAAGRLVDDAGLFLVGEVATFSLATSGLVTGSSPPETSVESTGVAGAGSSGSAGVCSAGTGSVGACSAGRGSAGAGSAAGLFDSGSTGGATGSSAEAMMELSG